jgi:CPA2 family monovalent cation:H+ antiporter-2
MAVALTVAMNVLSGMFSARVYGFGPLEASNISTTLMARGEFALILATMAAGAGLDERLSPFIAGYVLVLAVLAPLAAGRSTWLARILPGGRVKEKEEEKVSVPA